MHVSLVRAWLPDFASAHKETDQTRAYLAVSIAVYERSRSSRPNKRGSFGHGCVDDEQLTCETDVLWHWLWEETLFQVQTERADCIATRPYGYIQPPMDPNSSCSSSMGVGGRTYLGPSTAGVMSCSLR